MPKRYKYTQETGTDFKVNNEDKADALEDTNEVRQILDDLGDSLGHSKFNDLYPADTTSGGDIDARRVTTKTGTGTLTIGEAGLILVSAASSYTLGLPTAVGNKGRIFIFVKTDATSNLITIDGNASETINGLLTYTGLNYQYDYVAMKSDNSNWIILNSSIAFPKVHSAVGSTNIETASTSYVDMADMSITATFPAGKVLIGFVASVTATNWQCLEVATVVIDGSSKIAEAVRVPDTADKVLCLSMSYVGTLTAGEHTIKIQWKTSSSTIYQDGASYNRILTILECR